MNPILVLSHNCLSLTQKCVESIRNQDIPTYIMVVDNGSQDGSKEWIMKQSDLSGYSQLWAENEGVSKGWNYGLNLCFTTLNADNVLVLNNDAVLGKSFLTQLLSCNVPFVSGSETTDLADLDKDWPSLPLSGGPQFSAFLIRREAWEKIGKFNELMWGWASDCDYHVRAHQLGISLQCSPTRYYHERSSTLKSCPPKERRQLELQADADREVFKEIYGVYPGDPVGYAALFK